MTDKIGGNKTQYHSVAFVSIIAVKYEEYIKVMMKDTVIGNKVRDHQ